MSIKKKLSEETGDLTEKVGVIERIAKLLTKYGYGKIISSLIIFILCIGTAIIYTNQKEIVQKIILEQKKEEKQKYVDNLRFRVEHVNPRVESILYKLLIQTKADRAFIFEMHNGVDNPTGLPFIYGDMSYESIAKDTLTSLINDYQRINLSIVPMATYIFKNKKFVGTVKELDSIDHRMANDIGYRNVKFIVLYSIRTIDVEIGLVGITYYRDIDVNIKTVECYMLDASQKLSILLDISNNIKDNQ